MIKIMRDPTIKLDGEIKEKLTKLIHLTDFNEIRKLEDEIRMLNIRKAAVERMKRNGVKF